MRYQDIFIQILFEVSGTPKDELASLLAAFRKTHPGDKWDQELSEQQANELLAKLRKEGPGITRWLHEGATLVKQHESGSVN